MHYLCSPNSAVVATIRELSSVGLEHLPYKQRVIGSTPIAPTQKPVSFDGLFSFSRNSSVKVFEVVLIVLDLDDGRVVAG